MCAFFRRWCVVREVERSLHVRTLVCGTDQVWAKQSPGYEKTSLGVALRPQDGAVLRGTAPGDRLHRCGRVAESASASAEAMNRAPLAEKVGGSRTQATSKSRIISRSEGMWIRFNIWFHDVPCDDSEPVVFFHFVGWFTLFDHVTIRSFSPRMDHVCQRNGPAWFRILRSILHLGIWVRMMWIVVPSPPTPALGQEERSS